MVITRRGFIKTGAALSAGLLLERNPLADYLLAKAGPVRVGATDWNLRQECKVEAIELAKRIGFDGVEVSLGVGDDKLPLSDADVQRRYLAAAKQNGLPIASTCLNILHRNILKSDPLAQRWVVDSIPITKNLGARVILLPFFGKGALKTPAEMDYVGDYLREIGPMAEKTGVILGVENTISAEDNARILDRARSKAVQVYYDVGNSTGGGFDVVKEIRWLGKDRICEFHFKDNPNFLGEGKINFPAIVDAIADIDFSGWIHLETSTPTKSVENDMARNLRFTRELLAKKGRG